MIRGRVQGVFFRASAADEANRLGLTGWVRNCANGDVEAVACGDEVLLQQFENWLHQGPPSARVSEVVVKETEIEKPLNGFSIKYK